MRQPEPPDAIEQLREFLRFAVPMRAITLAHDHRHLRPAEMERLLIGWARAAGQVLGTNGDGLVFSGREPRTGRAQARVIRTADDLVTGVAAAALLAQLDGRGGVRVFGDWHGTPGSVPPGEAR